MMLHHIFRISFFSWSFANENKPTIKHDNTLTREYSVKKTKDNDHTRIKYIDEKDNKKEKEETVKHVNISKQYENE